VPLAILLSVGHFDPSRSGLDREVLANAGSADANCQGEHHNHDHSKTLNAWSYETNRPLSLEILREVARKLPGNVDRCKGVIDTSDAPARRAVLQGVGRRVDLSDEEAWGERERRTRIALIAAAGGVDQETLRERLESCVDKPEIDAILTNQSE
jgi:G3E family GTPase